MDNLQRSMIGGLAALLLLACGAYAQSDRSLVREGNRQYKQEKFADAEVNYRKALEKNNAFRAGSFNLGDALYKQGRYGEAAQQYLATAEREKDPGVKGQAFHNLGNSLLKAQKIPESIAAYQNALKLNPTDMDTKYNLEYAKMLLQKQQQQQQQQKQDQKQNKDNKQDQQKQQQQQQKQDEKQQPQQQQKKQQISKADAERILEALKNQEKDVQKRLKKKVPARIKVEKDW